VKRKEVKTGRERKRLAERARRKRGEEMTTNIEENKGDRKERTQKRERNNLGRKAGNKKDKEVNI
jgi:hypothetical protein